MLFVSTQRAPLLLFKLRCDCTYVAKRASLSFHVPKGSSGPALSVIAVVPFIFAPRQREISLKESDMEQTSESTPETNLSTYRGIIERFLPFVLVRCSKYTNSKVLAEVIAIYAFICAYRLAEILDGANKMAILIDNMVGVVGEDLSKGTSKSVNGKLLFKWEDDLRFAQRLAEMGMKECLDEIRRHPDLTARNFDLNQFESITESAMKYLKISRQH
ncbi:MAG: hypothetical protein ABSB25_11240 [Sedimentisphaerales bacterium]